MRYRMRSSERGLAMLESAIFLPLFLMLLFGIIWAVQSSVQSERVQIAVRYSGLVSNEAAPYVGYSLYGLYNAVAAPAVPTSCVSPASDALTDSGTFPGPQAQPFWSPESGTTNGTCTKGTAILTGGSLSSDVVFLHTTSDISTQVSVPTPLQSTLGNDSTLTATQNFFDTPDLGTLMKCYSDLETAVGASLQNTAQNVITAPTPLPDDNPTNPLPVGSC